MMKCIKFLALKFLAVSSKKKNQLTLKIAQLDYKYINT